MASTKPNNPIRATWYWLQFSFQKIYRSGESLSYWATISAAVVTIFAFSYGYRQFRETQQATRETLILQRESLDLDRDSKAVELLIKYNDLMRETQAKAEPVSEDAEFWQENLAFNIAESIFKLRAEDKGWRETVRWIITNHAAYWKDNGLDCPTYDAGFVEFVNQVLACDVCNAKNACAP